ncbi:MAG: HAMP domain-containing histidine kinase [Pseudomonadales bacterium]|nr:HAMP domain-containing histidine kinase [Candidatus Woesebacteria bacterium]MCB9801296.1 HAMP domain-containing histidine kinase [Pseudomonadales bacterium]
MTMFSGMFHSARIKLTLWYLVTIMVISLLFSVALYFSFSAELERNFARAKVRVLAEEHNISLPLHWRKELENLDDPRLQEVVKSQLMQEDLALAKESVFLQLILINGILAFFSIFAGWLLAGKTLAPIQKAHEDQKQFIADASHELRTPVAALKTLLEVFSLKKKPTLADTKELVATSQREVEQLHYLVDKLLRLTVYQGNRRQLSFRTFNLQRLVKRVIKTIKPLAVEKDLELILSGDTLEVQADEEKIQELMSILLENAIKYTQEGSVAVVVKAIRNQAVILVKDTGVGIAEADLNCIFNRFYRVDQSRTSKGASGFGLGLAVAKEIVEMHGGMISVSSQVGKGSTFKISFPLSQK